MSDEVKNLKLKLAKRDAVIDRLMTEVARYDEILKHHGLKLDEKTKQNPCLVSDINEGHVA